jgi:hypothetical protein
VISTVDPILQTDLTILLTNGDNDADNTDYSDPSTFSLKQIEDLKIILRDIPFSFGYFQNNMEKLMFRWAQDNIPTLQPLLEKSMSKNPASNVTFMTNQRERKRQVQKFQGRSQKTDEWDYNDTNASNPSKDEEKPQFIRHRKPAVKFTQEEKDAIKDGVRRIGLGRWSEIRDAYPVLHHRTYSKAIKVSHITNDCRFATLLNQLSKFPFDEPCRVVTSPC